MKTIQAHTKVLKGSNYEIGVSLGSMTASVPELNAFHTSGFPGFSGEDTTVLTNVVLPSHKAPADFP